MVEFEGSPFIDRNLFYKFNIAYWRKLFQVGNYTSIDIVASVEYVESGIGKDIIIVVETERQDRFHKIKDFISNGHIVYKVRVVIAINGRTDSIKLRISFQMGILYTRSGW